MATISHKQLLNVTNTAPGTNAGWSGVWAATRVMLAAGWKYAGSSDGTTKDASTDPELDKWLNTSGSIGTSTASGTGAIVAAPVRGRAVVTGLTGMTSAMKGSFLKLSGSSNAVNNHAHQIEQFISATSVAIDARNFAVVADTGLTWDVRNPLTETYKTALTASVAWWCAIGPHVLKIPITAAPSGVFIPGERIIQAVTGFEGELRDFVWSPYINTGYLTVFGQVRGTGAGVYGLATANAFTGQSTGYTATQSGTAKEFRLECVVAKASGSTLGTVSVGVFDISTDTRISGLVSSAGCTASVRPGGGGTGNTAPTFSWLALGNVAWMNTITGTVTAGNSFAVCADALEEQYYSADGSWTCATLATNNGTWSPLGVHLCDSGEAGDMAPWVFIGPQILGSTSDPTFRVGIKDTAYALTPADTAVIETIDKYAPGSFMTGFAARDTADQTFSRFDALNFIPSSGALVAGNYKAFRLGSIITGIVGPGSSSASGNNAAGMASSTIRGARVLVPAYVGNLSTFPDPAYGSPARKVWKGRLRWVRYVDGWHMGTMHNYGAFYQLAGRELNMAVGPFAGQAPAIATGAKFYFGPFELPDGNVRSIGGEGYAAETAEGLWNLLGGKLSATSRGTLTRYPTGAAQSGRLSNFSSSAANKTYGIGRWFSPPIAAQTVTGPVTGRMRFNVSSAATTYLASLRVWILAPDGTNRGFVVETLPSSDLSGGSPFTTTSTNRTINRNPTYTPVVASAGDQIVVELGVRCGSDPALVGVFMDSGSGSTGDLPLDESTTTTTLAAWIQFGTSIVLLGDAPAVDVGGGLSGGSLGSAPIVPQDTSNPVVSNVSPPNGSNLQPADTFSFDVTDTGTMLSVQVGIYIKAWDTTELAWNGDSFESQYSGSTRTPITNGHRYVLKRKYGWPTSGITPKIRAIDGGGNTSNILT